MRIRIKLETWKNQVDKIRVAIIGTGTIGCDLAERMLRDPQFEVVALIGRRKNSPGLNRFLGRVPNILSDGIDDLRKVLGEIDGVFDATSAHSHKEHWIETKGANKWMVDLTPSRIGKPMVPQLIDVIPGMSVAKVNAENYSMITCGGQSGAPIAFALSSNSSEIHGLEISSSIAALSAGPATRDNIDQYIESTECLMEQVSGSSHVKAILVLNPANPPVMMRTTVTVSAKRIDINACNSQLHEIVNKVKNYVPGYELVTEPHLIGKGIVTATIKVSGAGYFLPSFAGNLDIINAAAVQTAKLHTELIKHEQAREDK